MHSILSYIYETIEAIFIWQFKQYSFDDSNNIHSIIQQIFIQWFEQNSFDDAHDLSSILW